MILSILYKVMFVIVKNFFIVIFSFGVLIVKVIDQYSIYDDLYQLYFGKDINIVSSSIYLEDFQY